MLLTYTLKRLHAHYVHTEKENSDMRAVWKRKRGSFQLRRLHSETLIRRTEGNRNRIWYCCHYIVAVYPYAHTHYGFMRVFLFVCIEQVSARALDLSASVIRPGACK